MNLQFHTHEIYLFAYYPTPNNNNNSNRYKANWLWEKCDDIISKTLKTEFKFNITEHLNLDLENRDEEPWANLNKYFEKTDDYHPIYIQPHNYFVRESIKNINPESKTCIVYPVELYDSYGLGIKINFPKNNNSKVLNDKNIELLNPDNCLILDDSQENEDFLGQTLLITIKSEEIKSYRDNNNQEKLKNIADEYIKSLLPDNFRNPPFNRSGFLFESPIFQYGIIRAPKSYTHIIIYFLLDDENEKKFKQNYTKLLDLFFFRDKIIHAYEKVRKIEKISKEKSVEIYSEIRDTQKKYNGDQNIKNREETNELDLEKLQNLLIEIPKFSVEYAEHLRSIKEYQNKIIENTRNYNDKICEIKSDFSNEDFSFLEFFTSNICKNFQERVMGAVQFFQLDINFINNTIDSIRGQVAIEQTYRERQLQVTITSLGIGIAVAGNLASSYEAGSIAENNAKPDGPHNNTIKVPFYEKPINLPFHIPHFIFSFTTSILVGFIAWQGALKFFHWWYKEEQLIRKTNLSKFFSIRSVNWVKKKK